jgi:hypothetical protein
LARCTKVFCEGGHPDFSWEWGQNERSQLGFLASAATQIGGLSVVESWTMKFPEGEKEYSGTNDLWLRLCPPTSDLDYFIEAKFEPCLPVAIINQSASVIVNHMTTAKSDAQSLKDKTGRIGAMIFASLKYENDNLDRLDQETINLISHIWNEIRGKQELDAIGAIWMGAADLRHSRDERKRDNISGGKNVHYGMICLACRIK